MYFLYYLSDVIKTSCGKTTSAFFCSRLPLVSAWKMIIVVDNIPNTRKTIPDVRMPLPHTRTPLPTISHTPSLFKISYTSLVRQLKHASCFTLRKKHGRTPLSCRICEVDYLQSFNYKSVST